MEVLYSKNRVPIRLTAERWIHIVENHDDLAGKFHDVLETVAEPDVILAGQAGELLAVRFLGRQMLVVAYKEISRADGFVITAFQTSKGRQLINARKSIWRKSRSSTH